mmetsp:Transcript_4357/g.10532  ORF Transcript_4357/g.10532 Transcript_4357/m.10532 type:complete len:467 (+) Transcript_4357:57-1457(+)
MWSKRQLASEYRGGFRAWDENIDNQHQRSCYISTPEECRLRKVDPVLVPAARKSCEAPWAECDSPRTQNLRWSSEYSSSYVDQHDVQTEELDQPEDLPIDSLLLPWDKSKNDRGGDNFPMSKEVQEQKQERYADESEEFEQDSLQSSPRNQASAVSNMPLQAPVERRTTNVEVDVKFLIDNATRAANKPRTLDVLGSASKKASLQPEPYRRWRGQGAQPRHALDLELQHFSSESKPATKEEGSRRERRMEQGALKEANRFVVKTCRDISRSSPCKAGRTSQHTGLSTAAGKRTPKPERSVAKKYPVAPRPQSSRSTEPRQYADVGAVPGLPVYQKSPTPSPARAVGLRGISEDNEDRRKEEARKSVAEVRMLNNRTSDTVLAMVSPGLIRTGRQDEEEEERWKKEEAARRDLETRARKASPCRKVAGLRSEEMPTCRTSGVRISKSSVAMLRSSIGELLRDPAVDV